MSYDADTEDSYIDNDESEIDFYTGYTSPADEWKVTRTSLFREFTGSVFTPTDKMSFRLARLNEKIAFAESPDTKKVNKKNYISDRFNFLQEFIPYELYTKITEIMAFTDRTKKKIARDISMNVETLSTILSLWQLELHCSGGYVTEQTLNDINIFLKEISTFSEFRCKGHITSKDIERAEARILRQLYSQTYELNTQDESDTSSNKLPPQVLNYYQDFMVHLEDHLNDKQKEFLDKKTNQRSVLPFHVYLLAQKIELMKKILFKVSLDYLGIYIKNNDYNNLCKIIDVFYHDKNAIAGELITQTLTLLEFYFQKEAKIDEMPKKFQTRMRKYRLDLKEEFVLIIDQVKNDRINLSQNTKKLTIQSRTETDEAEVNQIVTTDDIVEEIFDHLENLTIIDESTSNDKTTEIESLLEQATEENIIPDIKQQLSIRYSFVRRVLGIPEELFNAILDLLVWYDKITFNWSTLNKNKINITTIALIVACWQLLAYEQGTIIPEKRIEKLKRYLHPDPWNKNKSIFASKMLERGQNEILKKMFEEQLWEFKKTGESTNQIIYS